MALTLLVCGGRDFNDDRFIYASLDYLRTIYAVELLIHGGARGADLLAGNWALDRGISQRVFRADWDAYGKRAGGIRNGVMLQEGRPNYAIAFPGGAGTADMVRRLRRENVVTWFPYPL